MSIMGKLLKIYPERFNHWDMTNAQVREYHDHTPHRLEVFHEQHYLLERYRDKARRAYDFLESAGKALAFIAIGMPFLGIWLKNPYIGIGCLVALLLFIGCGLLEISAMRLYHRLRHMFDVSELTALYVHMVEATPRDDGWCTTKCGSKKKKSYFNEELFKV